MRTVRAARRLTTVVAATAAILGAASCDGSPEPDGAGDPPTPASSTPTRPGDPGPGTDHAGRLHTDLPLGEDRFDLYAPASYDGSRATPAVIALHGRPGSSVESQARLAPLADEQDFLAAYPRLGTPRWRLEPDSPDIGFLRDLIAELVESWQADPARIYVTGMSAGADMAIAVGLHLADLVAAVAPVAPPGSDAVAELVDRHGTAVPVVAFLGAEDTRFVERGLDLLATWRDRAGCGQEQRTEAAELTTTRWRCDGGAPMTVHVLERQGHIWFGSPDDREPLWASEVMWDFFRAR